MFNTITPVLRRYKVVVRRAINVFFTLMIIRSLPSTVAAQSAILQDTNLAISTTSGNHGIIFQDGTKQTTAAGSLATTEVMASSGDITSSANSVSIALPVGTKTPYRVVYAIKKDATDGTIAVYANGDTSGTWTLNKYGAINNGGTGQDLVNQTATGCLISVHTNNQAASTILQGQFYFTSLFQNDKAGLIYGLATFSNGSGTTPNDYIAQESGGCIGPTESGNISTIGFRALTGNISLMHWEIWQGATHQ